MKERLVEAINAELTRQAEEPVPGALALYEASEPGKLGVDGPLDLSALARAILQAIREPTEAMTEAAHAPDRFMMDATVKAIWRDMIAAALAEPPTD